MEGGPLATQNGLGDLMPARLMDRSAILFSSALEIFLFQLRHTNRFVEARTHWRTVFHAEARCLQRPGNLFAGEKDVHASGGLFALGHSVDDFAGAVGAIAPGTHLGEIP